MKRNQPQYFSDHFNIDKAKLQELGVFDPILNFDTKGERFFNCVNLS